MPLDGESVCGCIWFPRSPHYPNDSNQKWHVLPLTVFLQLHEPLLQSWRNIVIAMPVRSVTSSILLESAERLGTPGPISPSPALMSPGWAEGQAQVSLEACGPRVGLDLPLTVWACSGHIIFLSLSYFICNMGFKFCPLELYRGWRRNHVSEGPCTQRVPHTDPVTGTADADLLQLFFPDDICV